MNPQVALLHLHWCLTERVKVRVKVSVRVIVAVAVNTCEHRVRIKALE